MPASDSVNRYSPDVVGVSVPVHLADQAGGAGVIGGLVASTCWSTSVTLAGPAKLALLQYCPSNPGPVPEAGVRTAGSTSVGDATSPAEPCTVVTLTPACAARAAIPCAGVIA